MGVKLNTAAVLLLLSLSGSAQSLQILPPRLDTYLATVVRLSASERKKLLAGSAVTKFLESDTSKEVSVFGAIWIDAPLQRYAEAVKDIEAFENGGSFKITKRITSPPRLEDFAELRLPKGDVADLRLCRVGKCKLKLSRNGIEMMRNVVHASEPISHTAVEEGFRRLAYAYVTGYVARGNESLAVYHDAERPIVVETELESMVDRIPDLTSHLPEIRRYLLEYPSVTLSDSSEFLYWQEVQFGLKPTIRINHFVIKESPEETVVVSKMLYASHYFWSALELRVLVPDISRGRGFWLVTVNRSRSDGLGGFLGPIIRGRVRGEVRKGVLAFLDASKKKMELRAIVDTR